MSMFSHRQLIGKDVISSDGKQVGEVSGIDMDVSAWKVLSLEVKLEKEVHEPLSLKKPVFGVHSIKITVDKVSAVSDKVVLNATLTSLAPTPNGEAEASE